jgi:predicted transcriptional regulator
LSKLSLFFQLLKDESWHSISELSEALNVSQNRLSEMAKLLMEHNLIEYKRETEQVKINPKWKFICDEYNESGE